MCTVDEEVFLVFLRHCTRAVSAISACLLPVLTLPFPLFAGSALCHTSVKGRNSPSRTRSWDHNIRSLAAYPLSQGAVRNAVCNGKGERGRQGRSTIVEHIPNQKCAKSGSQLEAIALRYYSRGRDQTRAFGQKKRRGKHVRSTICCTQGLFSRLQNNSWLGTFE